MSYLEYESENSESEVHKGTNYNEIVKPRVNIEVDVFPIVSTPISRILEHRDTLPISI